MYRLLVLALTAASLASPDLATAARPTPSLQILEGENLLAVSEDTQVQVKVPSAVPLSAIKVKIIGEGDAALALIGTSSAVGSPPTIYTIRSQRCLGDVCSSRQSPLTAQHVSDSLAPGHYRLVALTSSPAVYELRFTNLGGKRRLIGGTAPKRVALRSVDPSPLNAQLGGVFSGGIYQRPSEEGLSALFMWWKSDRYSAAAFGSCYYVGRPPFPREIAFTPSCPGAGWHPKIDGPGTQLSEGGSFLISTFEYVPAAVGGWFSAPAPTAAQHGGAAVLTIYPGNNATKRQDR